MKKLSIILLLALLSGTAHAQLNDSLFKVIFESQPGVRPWKLENVIITSATSRLDMNDDGGIDLLLQRDDDQGYLKDLRVLDGRTRTVLWGVADACLSLNFCRITEFWGFADPDGDGEREALFISEQAVHLINPGDNTLGFSWGETNDSTHELVGVADLTGDGYEEILFYLPDTKQIQVWSKF